MFNDAKGLVDAREWTKRKLTPTGLPSPSEVGMQEYRRLYRQIRAADPDLVVAKRESQDRWYRANKETPSFKARRRIQVKRRQRTPAHREYQRRWKTENRRTQRQARPSQRWYVEQIGQYVADGLSIRDRKRTRPSDWREDAAQDRILAELEAAASAKGAQHDT